MTRNVILSIDNMFRVEVPDDATESQILELGYAKFQSILDHSTASDFDFIIEEDYTE